MKSEPKLRRELGLGSLTLFGLAYMTPMIVYGTFGILSDATAAAVPSAYLFALVAMLFTAFSYGQLAKRHPVSGSAYSYTLRTFGSIPGFLVGWVVLLDYLFLPMVIWLIGATYLADTFPQIPSWVFLLAFIGVTTAINILGLKLANRVNVVILIIQVVVMATFSALLAIYCVGTAQQVPDLLRPLSGTNFSFSAIVAGAAIASYSFLGFDAVSTLAEEAKDPKNTVPRAILAVTLIGGLLFLLTSYVAQLAFPTGQFSNPDAASSEMAVTVGGHGFLTLFLTTLIFAQLASGIAAQASGSRLIYVMARDGALPAILSRLHERHLTPAMAIFVTGGIGLVAIGLDVTTSTSFINFGAMLAFFAVNMAALVNCVKDARQGQRLHLFIGIALPTLGGASNIFLLANLHQEAIILGIVWLVVGGAYLAGLTRFFTRPASLSVADGKSDLPDE